MPKIIIFTSLTLWSMGNGSGGPAFTQTVKKYIDKGWDVFLVSDEPRNRDYPHLDSAHNILLQPSPFKKYGGIRKFGLVFRWLDHLAAIRSFCKQGKVLLKQGEKATILYAYEVFGVKACAKMAKRFSLPLVTRFQGTILSQYENNWRNHIKRYPHYHALSQSADLVIMTDDGTLGDKVLRELGNTSPTLFLRNGLELLEKDVSEMKGNFERNAFRSSLGVSADEIMFLTVSRLTGWKKVERVIDGFSAFCKHNPCGKLIIVGEGDTRASLEHRATELGISDRVKFTGSIAHDDVYNYMMACDVFLSLYDLSNVGNPLLEAMTLGKCIVTLDVGDTRSLIRNRENGILLTIETLPSLGDVMIELAEDDTLRTRLGEAASEYAHTHFQTWQERMETEVHAVSRLLS